VKLHEDKYIVVTGGAGFIGSCLVRYLNDLGIHHLIIVDHLGKREKWKNIVGKRFKAYLQKDQLFEWLYGREQDIEAFIHLGACSSTLETDASYLIENNYQFSIQLAEYALENDHRFIYASSAATYGNGGQRFSDDHEKLGHFRPLNMYGFSKHLFDLWIQDQHLLDHVVGLKYFNVFGPNEFHKGPMASALVKIVPEAISSGKIKLFKSSDPMHFSDGEQVRDFIYVKDAVKMTAQFLTNDHMGIYNVGSGVPSTWNQLARAVIDTLGLSVEIEYVPMPHELMEKYQNYTCADMQKSKALGLCLPEFTLEEAIKDYLQNYLIPGNYW
jgi:ADP-L-glycero-D-manno-heptose 6-epimerase